MRVCIQLSGESELRDFVGQLPEIVIAKEIISRLKEGFPNLEISTTRSINQVEFDIDQSFDRPTTIQIPIVLIRYQEPFVQISLMRIDKGYWEGDIFFTTLNLVDRVLIHKTKEELLVDKVIETLREALEKAGRKLIDLSTNKA